MGSACFFKPALPVRCFAPFSAYNGGYDDTRDPTQEVRRETTKKRITTMEPQDQDSKQEPSRTAPSDSSSAESSPPSSAPEQRIILQMPSPWGRFGWRILLTVLIISLLINLYQSSQQQAYLDPGAKVNERYVSGSKTSKQKIAIIRLTGTIMKGDGFVKQQIDRVMKDDAVEAVVLRVDTPGGTVTGSSYIYHYLKKMAATKPLVVSMGGICTSGGYYVAMAVGDRENVLFAEPSTWTGSIGVIIPHYDVSKLLKKWEIEDDSISMGPDKQVGSPTRALNEEERKKEREILKSLVRGSYEQFKEIVLEGRPALRDNEEHQKLAFSSRVFSASQAKEIGLIDQTGFLEHAIERAVELAGIDSVDNVRVVKYTRHEPGLIEVLGGIEASPQAKWAAELRTIMRLSVPRPYYLPNWMPGVLVEPEAK